MQQNQPRPGTQERQLWVPAYLSTVCNRHPNSESPLTAGELLGMTCGNLIKMRLPQVSDMLLLVILRQFRENLQLIGQRWVEGTVLSTRLLIVNDRWVQLWMAGTYTAEEVLNGTGSIDWFDTASGVFNNPFDETPGVTVRISIDPQPVFEAQWETLQQQLAKAGKPSETEPRESE